MRQHNTIEKFRKHLKKEKEKTLTAARTSRWRTHEWNASGHHTVVSESVTGRSPPPLPPFFSVFSDWHRHDSRVRPHHYSPLTVTASLLQPPLPPHPFFFPPASKFCAVLPFPPCIPVMIRPRQIPIALLCCIALPPLSRPSTTLQEREREREISPSLTAHNSPLALFFLLSLSISLCVQVVRMRAYVDSATSKKTRSALASRSNRLRFFVPFPSPRPHVRHPTSEPKVALPSHASCFLCLPS